VPRLDKLLLLFALASQAVAHGPEIGLEDLRVVSSDEGRFLEMRVDPPEGGAVLTAVSTPSGSAILESRKGGDYLVTDRIPLDYGQGALGAATAYRIRLPEIRSRERTTPVTLLFGGGNIIHAQAGVVSRPTGLERWLPAGVAALAVIGALTVKLVKAPKRESQGSNE
jgi:hypothetical protein